MSKKQDTISIQELENLHTAGAGYDILRYVSLPDLLGSEKETLLYFMGKNLARKFEIEAMGDLMYFFDKVGWGKLDLFKEKRKELIFHLLSDSVVKRIESPLETDFRMEAGFLAEAIHKLKGMECECIEEVNRKLRQVEFKVIFV
ncbi:YslB family protein [Ornithinibacillus halophilus]|uniref:DUF2507 domain-containing protein n=1 Tax=Ornithinibacillus halophilus TaxID=930117 RepID=A0A1M5MSD4_9BACI|nr:YslB family protein [Ornithinibacillus halophilus]SHG80208.1 Protein of unknown function [Ornithinibacillus halophilus]